MLVPSWLNLLPIDFLVLRVYILCDIKHDSILINGCEMQVVVLPGKVRQGGRRQIIGYQVVEGVLVLVLSFSHELIELEGEHGIPKERFIPIVEHPIHMLLLVAHYLLKQQILEVPAILVPPVRREAFMHLVQNLALYRSLFNPKESIHQKGVKALYLAQIFRRKLLKEAQDIVKRFGQDFILAVTVGLLYEQLQKFSKLAVQYFGYFYKPNAVGDQVAIIADDSIDDMLKMGIVYDCLVVLYDLSSGVPDIRLFDLLMAHAHQPLQLTQHHHQRRLSTLKYLYLLASYQVLQDPPGCLPTIMQISAEEEEANHGIGVFLVRQAMEKIISDLVDILRAICVVGDLLEDVYALVLEVLKIESEFGLWDVIGMTGVLVGERKGNAWEKAANKKWLDKHLIQVDDYNRWKCIIWQAQQINILVMMFYWSLMCL